MSNTTTGTIADVAHLCSAIDLAVVESDRLIRRLHPLSPFIVVFSAAGGCGCARQFRLRFEAVAPVAVATLRLRFMFSLLCNVEVVIGFYGNAVDGSHLAWGTPQNVVV